VMGKQAKNISQEEALDYVFGYATGNDISARDLQTRTNQWTYGKAIDQFAPIGPYLVTAEEVSNPQNLELKCWVNGELRQNSNTELMIFSIAEMISDLSQTMTLEPGDVIFTGTPEGVILGMKEKIWLKPGDEMVCEVEGLGKLVNRIAE
ncbi:fumarylacetoacetate hydrolase family protein, partial [Aeromonas veronii]|nr:fumarylacetoacetate hydrolase family protein [Aeromonas veronii]